MSLYRIGQRVVLRSTSSLCEVVEANYIKIGDGRRAVYLVKPISSVQRYEYGKLINLPREGQDFLTGGNNLSAADYNCDSCGNWRKGSPHRVDRDRDGAVLVAYCFPCVKTAQRNGEIY